MNLCLVGSKMGENDDQIHRNKVLKAINPHSFPVLRAHLSDGSEL